MYAKNLLKGLTLISLHRIITKSNSFCLKSFTKYKHNVRAEFSASFLILYFGSEMPQSFSCVSVLSKYEIEKKLAAKE